MQERQEDCTESTSASGTASTAAVSSDIASTSASTSGTGTSVQRTRQITSFVRTPFGPVRQSKVDEELVKIIALDLQPFPIVDDTGFRRLFKALDPSYILQNHVKHSGTTALQKNKKEEVMVKVSKASAVCRTTDCWTSKTTTSFMAVTCHFIDESFTLSSLLLDRFSFTERHTADNLAAEPKKICDEWGIANKVVVLSKVP